MAATTMPGRRIGRLLIQAALLAALGLGLWHVVALTAQHLAARHIATGFGFLDRAAPLPIGESLIAYHASVSSYGRALLVGVLNTLKVALAGIVLSILLGGVIGLARLARNRLVASLAGAYVTLLRGIPLVLQLLIWYTALQTLPPPRQAWRLAGFLLTNRGLYFPWHTMPTLRGFNIQGGGVISPEYAALLLALVCYTAANIAEIMRAGILSVPRGQSEAAMALGLSAPSRMRLVILPQALRLMLPPLISECINLTKNSSLAVIVGYQDLMSIADTTLNQTGQAIEVMALVMVVYLTLSVTLSAAASWAGRGSAGLAGR